MILRGLVVVGTLVLVAYGIAEAGLLGALTGAAAGVLIGSALLRGFGQGDAMSASGPKRRVQQVGGLLAAALAGLGAWHGGWSWGWAWAFGGYLLGTILTVGVGLLVARR